MCKPRAECFNIYLQHSHSQYIINHTSVNLHNAPCDLVTYLYLVNQGLDQEWDLCCSAERVSCSWGSARGQNISEPLLQRCSPPYNTTTSLSSHRDANMSRVQKTKGCWDIKEKCNSLYAVVCLKEMREQRQWEKCEDACFVISPQRRPLSISMQAQSLRLSVRCVSQPPLCAIIGVLPSPIPWENCPGSHQTTSPPRTSWRRGSLSSTEIDREDMCLHCR